MPDQIVYVRRLSVGVRVDFASQLHARNRGNRGRNGTGFVHAIPQLVADLGEHDVRPPSLLPG